MERDDWPYHRAYVHVCVFNKSSFIQYVNVEYRGEWCTTVPSWPHAWWKPFA